MELETSVSQITDPPSGKAVRRYWDAWLIFMLMVLAGLIVVVLIAAIAADPASVSPAG